MCIRWYLVADLMIYMLICGVLQLSCHKTVIEEDVSFYHALSDINYIGAVSRAAGAGKLPGF